MFSQRHGYKPVKSVIQKDSIDSELKAALWNALGDCLWNLTNFMDPLWPLGMAEFSGDLWANFFKKPADERPSSTHRQLEQLRNWFFSCEWFEIYDLIEWIMSSSWGRQTCVTRINSALKKELAGYHLIKGQIASIIDTQEIEEIEKAIQVSSPKGAGLHLQTALNNLSDKKDPDYRNSIKESISAVESVARQISGFEKATLGDAIKEIEKKHALHPALKEAFLKLYGYTNDEKGVRHSMDELPNLGIEEATFFLVACSAFINYLRGKGFGNED